MSCVGSIAFGLGRMIDGKHPHRPGRDILFKAPKSVSLEDPYRGRNSVMRTHDEAVRAALDWIKC